MMNAGDEVEYAIKMFLRNGGTVPDVGPVVTNINVAVVPIAVTTNIAVPNANFIYLVRIAQINTIGATSILNHWNLRSETKFGVIARIWASFGEPIGAVGEQFVIQNHWCAGMDAERVGVPPNAGVTGQFTRFDFTP